MKLSEAILMNGMTKPQGFGGDSMYSDDAPCALGGALQSVGLKADPSDVNYKIVEDEWPWARGRVASPVGGYPDSVINTIWYLNDKRWTRAQIAEWVATIEPQEDPAPVQEETAKLVTL